MIECQKTRIDDQKRDHCTDLWPIRNQRQPHLWDLRPGEVLEAMNLEDAKNEGTRNGTYRAVLLRLLRYGEDATEQQTVSM